MDFGPPVSAFIEEHPLKDMARDAQLMWELSHQCKELMEDKRHLLNQYRKAEEMQDERQQVADHAESNLVAINEHFRLKIFGLMADAAHLEKERAEWTAIKIQSEATNNALRAELAAAIQEKALANETAVMLTKQVEQQLQSQKESTMLNEHLTEHLSSLEAQWQGVTDQWIEEKITLVNRASESRECDVREIGKLRKSCAAAENQIDTLTEKESELVASSEKLRFERDALNKKTVAWADEISDMKDILARNKVENDNLSAEIRVLQRQAHDSATSEKVCQAKSLADMQYLTVQLVAEKEVLARKTRDYETTQRETECTVEQHLAELRRVTLQRTNLERVNVEMEKQLTTVKQSYAKLEETMRHQSSQYELEFADMAQRLEEREQSRQDLKEELAQLELAGEKETTTVTNLRADLAESRNHNFEEAKLYNELIGEKQEASKNVASFDALFEQLKHMREWHTFELQHLLPSDKHASYADQTRLILRFVESQLSEITQLQYNMAVSQEENTTQTETISALQSKLAEMTAARQDSHESARRKALKLQQIKETILQWVESHGDQSCSFSPEMMNALSMGAD